MTALGTIVAASPLNADDGSRYTGFTTNADVTETATFALGDTPADFATMNTLSWTYDGRENITGGDDSEEVLVRIVNGATILAASTSGGTFQRIYIKSTGGFSTTDVTRGPTAFSYVNTTANKATWDGATVEIRRINVKNKGPDAVRPEPDYFAVTGDYDVVAVENASVTGLGALGFAVSPQAIVAEAFDRAGERPRSQGVSNIGDVAIGGGVTNESVDGDAGLVAGVANAATVATIDVESVAGTEGLAAGIAPDGVVAVQASIAVTGSEGLGAGIAAEGAVAVQTQESVTGAGAFGVGAGRGGAVAAINDETVTGSKALASATGRDGDPNTGVVESVAGVPALAAGTARPGEVAVQSQQSVAGLPAFAVGAALAGQADATADVSVAGASALASATGNEGDPNTGVVESVAGTSGLSAGIAPAGVVTINDVIVVDGASGFAAGIALDGQVDATTDVSIAGGRGLATGSSFAGDVATPSGGETVNGTSGFGFAVSPQTITTSSTQRAGARGVVPAVGFEGSDSVPVVAESVDGGSALVAAAAFGQAPQVSIEFYADIAMATTASNVGEVAADYLGDFESVDGSTGFVSATSPQTIVTSSTDRAGARGTAQSVGFEGSDSIPVDSISVDGGAALTSAVALGESPTVTMNFYADISYVAAIARTGLVSFVGPSVASVAGAAGLGLAVAVVGDSRSGGFTDQGETVDRGRYGQVTDRGRFGRTTDRGRSGSTRDRGLQGYTEP